MATRCQQVRQSHAVCLSLIALVTIAGADTGTFGQTTQAAQAPSQASPPPFQPMRYENYLEDKSRRSEWLDRVKYIPLDKRDLYLSLGGEARIRYEYFDNFNFGAGPQDDDGYVLERYLVHADADAIGLIGAPNSLALNPNLRLAVSERWTVSAGVAFFWRQSTRDGIYGINVAPLRAGGRSRARSIGTLPSVKLDWRISRHLTYTAIYSHFFAGRFLKETPPGEDINYVTTWLTFRF